MASLRHGHGNRSPPGSSMNNFNDYPQSPTSITKVSHHFEIVFFDSLPLQWQMNGNHQHYGGYFLAVLRTITYINNTQLRGVGLGGLPPQEVHGAFPTDTYVESKKCLYSLELISKRPDSRIAYPHFADCHYCSFALPQENKHQGQITSYFPILLISSPQ